MSITFAGSVLSALAFCLFVGQALAQDQEAASSSQTIHGTVVNSVTHAPISRALVRYSDRVATLTDSEGRFEFSSPAENAGGTAGDSFRINYSLHATKPGFLDVSNSGSRTEVSPNGDVMLSLVPEAIIKGRVVLSTGDGASGVNVQIYSRQVQNGVFHWLPGEQVQARSNGEFRFAELAAGAYKVLTHEFMDNDPLTRIPGGQFYGFPPVYYPNAIDFVSGSTIQLPAGEIFEADISLVQHPYFDVQIPVANPPESNNGLGVEVSPIGSRSPGYSLGYNQQKQEIDGSLPAGNYVVEGFSYGQPQRSGKVNLTVTGAHSQALAMVLTPNSSIALNVTEQLTSSDANRSGSGSDGRHTFTFRGPRAYLNPMVESADDFVQRGGSVRPAARDDDPLVIDNLTPGRYWLRLNPNLGYVASATMGGVDLLHRPFVVGSASSTPVEITVRDDFAEIEGRVAGVVATPAAPGASYRTIISGSMRSPVIFGSPAYVYCVPLPDSPGQFQQLGVDQDGKFASQTMPPGTYRVMAFKSRQPNLPYGEPEAMKVYESKGQVVHLSAGQKATVELQIIPGDE